MKLKSLAVSAISLMAFVVVMMPAPAFAAPSFGCNTARLIVPWSAGGGTDVIYRIVANAVNETGAKPGLQVVNIGGQGGNKGAKEARKSKKDGCTLFAIHQSAMTSYFTGRVDFSFEAFEPVALMTRTPGFVGAAAKTPWNNLKELVADAKKRPGEILAGGTLGSTSQFFFLLIEDAAGVKFKHVPYDGTRQRMTALLAGNIELGEINLTSARKHIEAGKLKALGYSGPSRVFLKDIPTMKEQGVDVIYGVERGIVLPGGTSADIVKHWEGTLLKACKDPKVVDALNKKGTLTICQNASEYGANIKTTFAKWKGIAKKVGVYKRKD
ncbi:Bug family tripartite tricarboxylate transporter substrate binding protein [Pseudomonadota bacterium]